MSFDGLLNRICNVEKATITQDADSGQMIETWGILLSAVNCRIEVKSGGKVVGPEGIYEKASHIVFMRKPAGITLTTKDHRIDIGGVKYEIILVINVWGSKPISHLELLLTKTE